jgi:hypothetical protein
VLVLIDGYLDIREDIKETLLMLLHCGVRVKDSIVVEANGNLKLWSQLLISEDFFENPLILILGLQEVRGADLENKLNEFIEQRVSQLLYLELFFLLFLLPSRFAEHYKILSSALLTGFNHLHHSAFLYSKFEPLIILQDFFFEGL